jgi:hypothetical protein
LGYFFLKEDCSQWAAFESSLDNTAGTTYVRSCNYSLPTATATALGNTAICAGDSVDIRGGGHGYAAYLWSNGATTIDITATLTGNYTLTVTDLYGCRDTSDAVVVDVSPEKPALFYSALGICYGGDAIIFPDIDYEIDRVSFLWNTGATNDTITVSQSGDYFLIVADTNGCSVSSDTVTINSYPNPQTPTITQQNDTLVVTAVSGTLQWFYFNDSIPNSNVTELLPTASGLYSVVVTDANGCASESAEYNYVVSGIFSTTINEWIIFPNPVKDILKIKTIERDIQNSSVAVFDVTGRKKDVTVVITENTLMLNIASLPDAVYFLRIESGNENYYHQIMKIK